MHPYMNDLIRCRCLLAGDAAGLLPHAEQEPQTGRKAGDARHAQQEEARPFRPSLGGRDGPARQSRPGEYFIFGVSVHVNILGLILAFVLLLACSMF